jgi:nucleotide-binding universal stress UspA family protein
VTGHFLQDKDILSFYTDKNYTEMNSILALIKEPEHSKGFITYLIRMGGDLGLNIHLLYVENPVNYPLGMPDTTGTASARLQLSMEKSAEDARQTLLKAVRSLAADTPDRVSVRTSTEIGVTELFIDKYLDSNGDSMLVLENQGHESLWKQDSTNMEIIRKCRCPVWIIPSGSTYHRYKEIVYATDYHEEDLTTLRNLLDLTGKFSPKITALHITDNPDFEARIKMSGFHESLHEKTSYDKISVTLLNEKEDEDFGMLINDFAALVDANLIVVLKENKHFLERIFTPDLTKKIIRQAKIPVLVYHEVS